MDLVGNTPLVKLSKVTGGAQPLILAKVEYFNPGGSVKDRIAVRMVDAAERDGTAQAGRHHRRADQRQHRGRPGHRGPGPRLLLRLRLPRQGERGQAQRPRRLRGRGRGLPDRGRTGPPRLLLLHLRPARPRDRGGLEARPVLQPEQSGQPLRDDRARDLAADRRPYHPLRRRHRHRRHHQRCRSLPQGGLRRAGAGGRGRPERLGLLRRQRPAVPGRGGRRGLLAHHVRPDYLRPDHRGLRRRLLRDDPAARPGGGAAGRRLVRDGRRGGDAARPTISGPTTWWSCCCRIRAAAT